MVEQARLRTFDKALVITDEIISEPYPMVISTYFEQYQTHEGASGLKSIGEVSKGSTHLSIQFGREIAYRLVMPTP